MSEVEGGAATPAPATPIETDEPFGPPAPGSSPPMAPPFAADPYPPAIPPKPPAEPRDLGWRFFVAVAVGAVAIDLALRNPPWNNVAATGGVLALVAAVFLTGRVRLRSAQVGLGLAAVLGFFLWLRTDPVLVAFDILGVVALGIYALTHARGQSMWDSGPLRLMVKGAESLVLFLETLIDGPAELAARQRRARESGRLSDEIGASLVRGAIITIPVLLILGLLLASADAVFASFFNFGVGVSLPSVIGHVVLLALGAMTMVFLLRVAGRELAPSQGHSESFRLGRIEALVLLVGLNLLFAGFAAAQVVALTGGAEPVLESAGLTFKEYARQGFFQLLWVASITLAVLVTLNSVTRHLEKGRRPVAWASIVAVVLTLVIVIVAFGRLQLYIDDDGLTPLRFYSSVFSVWIGVVFLLLAARILGFRSTHSWLTTAIGLSGVLVLVGLNVANPERIIAENNLDRDQWGIVYHMDKLTADGQTVLLNGLDRLSPDIREEVRDGICNRIRYDEFGFDRTGPGFNLSERRLDDAERAACPSP